MKTLKLIMVLCLLSVFTVNPVKAQSDKSGNGTVVDNFLWSGYVYPLPVSCDGVQIDLLTGEVQVKEEIHAPIYDTEGKIISDSWATHQCHGAVVSTSGSGEEFKVLEIDKKYKMGSPTQMVVINLIGNKGSHYNAILIYDIASGSLTPVKATCN